MEHFLSGKNINTMTPVDFQKGVGKSKSITLSRIKSLIELSVTGVLFKKIEFHDEELVCQEIIVKRINAARDILKKNREQDVGELEKMLTANGTPLNKWYIDWILKSRR